MDKQLKDKSIDIKGKEYVLVKDRIIYFNDTYKEGYIKTSLISSPDADVVVVKAEVAPSTKQPERVFIGHSQARWGDGYINKTSALENAETSAVGRALAMMGIGVIDSVASSDEINKANNYAAASVKPVNKRPVLTDDKFQDVIDFIDAGAVSAKGEYVEQSFFEKTYKLTDKQREFIDFAYETLKATSENN